MKCPACERETNPVCVWCSDVLPKPPSIWHKPSERPVENMKLFAMRETLVDLGYFEPPDKFHGCFRNWRWPTIDAWAYASDAAAWAVKEMEGMSDG